MFTPVKKIRSVLFGVVALAGVALAPSAFAGHLGVSVNVGLPGIGLGYPSCGHCGWGGHGYGYANVGYVGGYGPAYYPAYYGPTYYGGGYYRGPAYGVVYDRGYRG